ETGGGRRGGGLVVAFASRFDGIAHHPLDERRVDAGERPRAEQGLVEHVFVRRGRNPRGSRGVDQTGIELPPCAHVLRPLLGKLREREQACARVLSALGVVGGGGGQAMRRFGGALLHPPMKIGNRDCAGG